MENLEKAKQILKQYKQEHLLAFYEDLSPDQKQQLLDQICHTDFDQILTLYENSKFDEEIPSTAISPLPYIDKQKLSSSELSYYKKIGITSIQNKELAIVTLAGGQGTRLGYKGPKGTFELDTFPKKSLFEIICDELKHANSLYHVTIPWYIMTSQQNHADTLTFFEQKNWFNYPKDSIFFFMQSELPLIDISGNLLLEETYKIKEASNGNGDVFYAMRQANLLKQFKNSQIQWIFFSGVDNVLLNIVDPLFLGLTIAKQCKVASKTLRKQNAEGKDWIFARKNGKPSIIDSSYLTDGMKNAIDEEGNDLYRDINLLAHLFSLDAFSLVCNQKLPYHRAFKKNTFVNEEGMKQVPDKPNSFKFETFIFDAFQYFDDILLLRVLAEEEYAPIKDFNGPFNPEVATLRYEKLKLHQNMHQSPTKKST